MPNITATCDKYRQYHVEYTDSDKLSLADGEAARANKENLVAQGVLNRVDRGYVDPDGVFEVDPVIGAHIMIAQEQAKAQFKGWPPIPEDAEVSLRFPGIDPMGKHSIIEMKFAQREAKVKAALQSRPPQVQAYVQKLLEDRGSIRAGEIFTKTDNLKQMSRVHQQLTRAAKLCHDAAGSQQLEIYARSLETDTAVEQYDKLMQGIEYAAGVKKGPVPQEVSSFYQEQLHRPLDMEVVKTAQTAHYQPQKLEVEFENLDHKVLQAAFSEPENWGKRPPKPQEAEHHVPEQVIDAMVTPYARATADRALDPIYSQIEQSTNHNISRGDLIIIDGQTVRERMFEEYRAAGQKLANFESHYKRTVVQKANEYVAGALMSGKRVEAYAPDSMGRISKEPMTVTKTGYEPSPMQRVTLNSWERFWSKRGFYKEKTAQAAEYQRMAEARQRVQAYNESAKLTMDHGTTLHVKSQYFGDFVREHGNFPEPLHDFSATRSAMSTFAVCRMMMNGHKIEDIHDPAKLQAEKAAVGKEVLQVMTQPDKAVADKWAGEVLFNGMRLLSAAVDEAGKRINFTDPKQFAADSSRPYAFAAAVMFDASQEEARCRADTNAAAERFAPGRAKQTMDSLFDSINTVSSLFNYTQHGMEARNRLAGGITDQPKADLVSAVSAEATRRAFAEKIAQSPQTPLGKHFTFASFVGPLNYGAALQSDTTGAFAREAHAVETSVEQQRNIGKQLLSGAYQRRMEIQSDMSKGTPAFGLKAPEKAAEKSMQQSRQLQDTARKNAAPKPAGKIK